jgi:hypothetical protein
MVTDDPEHTVVAAQTLLASPAAWWFWTRLMHVGASG